MSHPLSRATVITERRGVRGTLSDIYHERQNFEFIARSWRWALLSGLALLIAVVALGVGGLNLGIDFEGGTQWQFTVSGRDASASDVRDALKGTAVTESKVLILGSDGVRVQAPEVKAKDRTAIVDALAKYAGAPAADISVTDVGPTWGDQVSRKALLALGFFFALIAAYLTFRFEWKMALAAIAAVLHDILITVGVYAVGGFEVTPATVVAFLTILGFSLYDTVVVFDKIKENVSTLGTERADTYSRMVNRSMNQVLMRSLNTSFVALLPVMSLLIVGSTILGAVTLRDFSLALFVGLLTGAYSSIFVATPILAWIKEREPRYVSLRERSVTQALKGERRSTSEFTERAIDDAELATVAEPPFAPNRSGTTAESRTTGAVAPRPRQQRRRKRR